MFGGTFGYVELLNMDARDLAYWAREARRKILFDQIRAIQAVRAGMADEVFYNRKITELRYQISDVDHSETIRDNWKELKRKRKG